MKIKKIIVVNFVILFVILFLVEGFNCLSYFLKIKESLELKNSANLVQHFRYTLPYRIEDLRKMYFTKYINPNAKKRSVLFVGCSYTYGSGIDEKDTLAYKIYQKTGRSVYKRGIPGGGIQLTLDEFDTGLMKKDVPDVEYIIYTYISFHIARLYAYQLDYLETEINQRYKLKKDKLVKVKQPIFPLYYSLFTVKNIQKYFEWYNSSEKYKEYDTFVLFNAVMKELLSEAKKNYKDVKFVILLYPSADNLAENRDIMPKSEIEKLEKMGFIVVNAEDLTDKPIRNLEYRVSDKDHPNADAWNVVAPALIKKLKL